MRRSSLVRIGLLLSACLLGSLSIAWAGKKPGRVKFHVARQSVQVVFSEEGVEVARFTAAFLAHGVVQGDGHARGALHLWLPDGRPLRYRVVSGEADLRDEGRPRVTLDLQPQGEGGPPGDRLVVATVQTDADNPDCLIWDIRDGCDSLAFDAVGQIEVEPGRG